VAPLVGCAAAGAAQRAAGAALRAGRALAGSSLRRGAREAVEAAARLAAEREARFGILAPAVPYFEGAWEVARATETALIAFVRAVFDCVGAALALPLPACRTGLRFAGEALSFAWASIQAAAGVAVAMLRFVVEQIFQVLAAVAAAGAQVDWPTVVVRAGLVLLIPSAMVLLAKRQKRQEEEEGEDLVGSERFAADFKLRPWAGDEVTESTPEAQVEEEGVAWELTPAPAVKSVEVVDEPAPAPSPKPEPVRKPSPPPKPKEVPPPPGSEEEFTKDLDAWQAFMGLIRSK